MPERAVTLTSRIRPGRFGLGNAPCMPALSAADVEEAFHASGDVDVRARTLLAWRNGLSVDSALNGSILGVHECAWEKAHHTRVWLSLQSTSVLEHANQNAAMWIRSADARNRLQEAAANGQSPRLACAVVAGASAGTIRTACADSQELVPARRLPRSNSTTTEALVVRPFPQI